MGMEQSSQVLKGRVIGRGMMVLGMGLLVACGTAVPATPGPEAVVAIRRDSPYVTAKLVLFEVTATTIPTSTAIPTPTEVPPTFTPTSTSTPERAVSTISLRRILGLQNLEPYREFLRSGNVESQIRDWKVEMFGKVPEEFTVGLNVRSLPNFEDDQYIHRQARPLRIGETVSFRYDFVTATKDRAVISFYDKSKMGYVSEIDPNVDPFHYSLVFIAAEHEGKEFLRVPETSRKSALVY